MTISDLIKPFGLIIDAGKDRLHEEVTGGHVGDLLSDVIAHSRKGNVWVTIQTHPNIVAVATMKELSGIILTGGRQPEAATIQRADQEGIPILTSSLFSFELVGKLYRMGISGPC